MAVIKAFSGEEILVDDEDFEFLIKYKWSVTKPGHRRTIYARTNIKTDEGKYVTERMHRLLMGSSRGDGLVVDHINGNGLDNRKENLRVANVSDNASNVSVTKNNSSGYKGVYFRAARNKWIVEIRKNRKTQLRKSFQCKHCAARFYNEKALEIHGEFAWLNEVRRCECVA